jgi:hypothetical protein
MEPSADLVTERFDRTCVVPAGGHGEDSCVLFCRWLPPLIASGWDVGPDQDRGAVAVGVGQLGKCRVEHRDVVGSGVGQQGDRSFSDR